MITKISIFAKIAQLYNLTEEEYSIILKDIKDDFRIKAQNSHRDLTKGLIK